MDPTVLITLALTFLGTVGTLLQAIGGTTRVERILSDIHADVQAIRNKL